MEFESEAKNPISACSANYINFLARFCSCFCEYSSGSQKWHLSTQGLRALVPGLELRLFECLLVLCLWTVLGDPGFISRFHTMKLNNCPEMQRCERKGEREWALGRWYLCAVTSIKIKCRNLQIVGREAKNSLEIVSVPPF